MSAVEERQFRGAHGETIVYDLYRPDVGEPRAVVVIAHGMGEHGRRYRHVVDALTGAGYLVAVPDHLGHGRSGGARMRITRFSQYTDDLARVISETGIDGVPTFLIGHSMGGCIALDYALDHPEAVAGLVLSGAAIVPGDDLPGPLIAVSKLVGKIAPTLPTLALDSGSISRDPAVVADYESDPLVHRGKIPARLGAEMVSTMQSFPARLPSLRMPVLVMHGSEDTLTNPDGSRLVDELASSTDKTLIIWDGLRHEIFNEPEKDEVIGTLTRWLAQRVGAS
ncbi:alpha/beta hydrolase [Gordonia sp. L191]|uniref:alpha/beta hydrolase n=1 Tax=Gordonia sp. L191 TaxID=2982699 RepID=UPI0024BF9998|nr:alpha/beta hydrolase [Gordonia sp. L191]WHU45551.1 alpha/beta hydrolase [Gordonia sp. L191]